MARPVQQKALEPASLQHVEPAAAVSLASDMGLTFSPDDEIRASIVEPVGTVPVAQLTTLHDGKTLNRDYTQLWENVGTGTGSFSNNTYPMSVTAGQYQIKQTRRFMPYFSGKPQKIELTFDSFAPQDGVTKRVGYFSSSTAAPYSATLDGVWLESSGGTIRLIAQNAGTETINLELSAAQWSGYANLGSYQTLATWDNFTVVEINFLWLGGAYIELKIMTSSGWVRALQYIYAGRQAGVFIKSPNQPVRYEIRSSTGAGSLTYICSQVATSGSVDESFMSGGIQTGHTAFTLASVGTTYPVIGIRKGATYRDNPVLLRSFGLFISSSDEGVWSLQVNPTLSGAASFTAVTDSAAEKANGNGTLTVSTPGYVIANGELTQGQIIPESILTRNYLAYLGGSITGTQDTVFLCFTPSTVNVSVRGSINYFEG